MSLNLVGQALSGTSTSTQTTTVSESGYTPGRLLFAQLSLLRSSGGDLADANFAGTGWIKLAFQGGDTIFNQGGLVGYRYATGDANDNCQASWGTANCRYMLNVYEDDAGIEGSPTAYTSGASDGGDTLTIPVLTPTAQPATVFSFANLRRWEQWFTDVNGSGMTVDSGFTIDWIGGQGVFTDTVPGCAVAQLSVTDLNAVQPLWITTDAVVPGGGNANGFNVVFTTTAVGTEWTPNGVTVNVDQVGLNGAANSASRVTADQDDGTVIGGEHTIVSANNTARFFLKRLVGNDPISVTMDNGATWSQCPALSTTEWTEVLIEKVSANPQIGLKIHKNGDSITVGNAELHPDMPASTVATSQFIGTTEEVVTIYSPAGEEQTGAWTTEPTWTYVPNNDRHYPIDDGAGSTEFRNALDPSGDTDAVITDPTGAGGGWSDEA